MTIFVKKGARPFYEGRLCTPHRYPDLAIRGAVIADSAKRNHAEAVERIGRAAKPFGVYARRRLLHVLGKRTVARKDRPCARRGLKRGKPLPHLGGGRRRGDAEKMREHALCA